MPELFTYSIENKDGKLVVTIGGSLIQESLNNLNAQMEKNSNLNVNALLSPILPISRILSNSMTLSAAESYQNVSNSNANYDEFLNQSIDQTYEDFKQQMQQIKESIEELKPEKQTQYSQSQKTKSKNS